MALIEMFCNHDRKNKQYSTRQNTIQMSISTFYKNKIFLFPCCRLLHYLLMWDLYWRNNKHFSTNLTYIEETMSNSAQVKVEIKSQFRLFFLLKKINFMGFYAVVLLEIFPFMYHYCCKSDIDKARMISFFRSTSSQIKIQFPFFLNHQLLL